VIKSEAESLRRRILSLTERVLSGEEGRREVAEELGQDFTLSVPRPAAARFDCPPFNARDAVLERIADHMPEGKWEYDLVKYVARPSDICLTRKL